MKHVEDNHIILPDHHGGLPGHSTVTAKAVIDYVMGKGVENDKLVILLSTDLSSAFDTVNHTILLEKLDYYGVKGVEKELIKSYLSDRLNYTEVDTKKSELKAAENCSVVQGSKLSGLMYILYTNEIPALKELLSDKETMNKLAKREPIETEDIEHETTNFVDDSNSVITFKDPVTANAYLQAYFDLMIGYYNQQKLKLNQMKTNLLVVSKPKLKDAAK